MKKEYVNSQITVVVFQTEDVIRTSIAGGDSYFENELPGVPFGFRFGD